MGDASIHVRVCRDCGEEYRPEIVRCADCGGELEDRHLDDPSWEPASGVLPVTAPPPVAPAGELRRITSSDRASDLEPLAERLGQAGVPFAVRGSYQAFELLVAEGDMGRALSELAPLLGEEPSAGSDGDFDPARGYSRCPACESAVVPGSLECPACGLGIGSPAQACPACGGLLGPRDPACPACGAARRGEG